MRILHVEKIRTPERGERLWDALFEIRIGINSWLDIPSDPVGYSRYREVKDAVTKTLMETAYQILELDEDMSWDIQDEENQWQILAQARRYIVKLRAVPLKEITSRQLLEDMLEGIEKAVEYIAGVNVDRYKEEYEFVFAQATSTLQNVTARIVELEHMRSEIRRAV